MNNDSQHVSNTKLVFRSAVLTLLRNLHLGVCYAIRCPGDVSDLTEASED